MHSGGSARTPKQRAGILVWCLVAVAVGVLAYVGVGKLFAARSHANGRDVAEVDAAPALTREERIEAIILGVAKPRPTSVMRRPKGGKRYDGGTGWELVIECDVPSGLTPEENAAAYAANFTNIARAAFAFEAFEAVEVTARRRVVDPDGGPPLLFGYDFRVTFPSTQRAEWATLQPRELLRFLKGPGDFASIDSSLQEGWFAFAGK